MTTQGQRFNDGKHGKLNVNPKCLPYDHSRVKLSKPVNGTEYVNASRIQTISREGAYDELVYNDFLPYSKIGFILSQDPTQDSQPHYLKMIHDNQINVVFHVASRKPHLNWKNVSYGDISHELTGWCDLNDTLVRQNITIRIKEEKTHFATILTFHGWPEDNKFDTKEWKEAKNFLSAITHLRKEIGKKNDTFTIMAIDRSGGIDGASACIVLFRLLEDMDYGLRGTTSQQHQTADIHSETINVFDTIKEMRKKRAYMIHSFATYEFLFDTLAFYARNKKMFDEMLMEIDAKEKSQKMAGRPKTSSIPTKRNMRAKKTPEEEFFGSSDSAEATDEELNNTRPSSVTYVYDEDIPIVRSTSVTYVYEEDKRGNLPPSASSIHQNDEVSNRPPSSSDIYYNDENIDQPPLSSDVYQNV